MNKPDIRKPHIWRSCGLLRNEIRWNLMFYRSGVPLFRDFYRFSDAVTYMRLNNIGGVAK